MDLKALVVQAVKSSEPVDSHKTTAKDKCTLNTRIFIYKKVGAIVLTRLSSSIESPFSPFCPSIPYNTLD